MATNFIESGVEIAVGIMVILLLGAYLLPVAVDAWFNATPDNDTFTNWSSAVLDLWDFIPLISVVGILLFFVGYAIYSAFRRFG